MIWYMPLIKHVHVCAMIHGFTLVCLDIQFILSSSSLPFATNIARSVSFLRSVFGKKIACRIGAEQDCGVARSSRVNNNGTIKKTKLCTSDSNQQLARLARSAMRETRLVAFLQAR